MNLFKREFKANLKALIIWTISSAALCYMSYWEYGLSDSADQMSDLFAGFPPIINTVFGVSPLGVNDIVGYSALIIYYIYFIGLIYALITGSKMIQKELDDQTSEFLFTKPITRKSVLLYKTVVAKINFAIFILANFLITIQMMTNIGDSTYSNEEIIKYMALTFFGLYILMLVTYMITIAASVFFTDKRFSMIAGGMFIMYSYASSIVILSFEKLNDLTILSPWRYFATDIVVNEGFSAVYLLICIIISIGFYLVANKSIQTKMM
ncbi:ABC transporter permease subunit [Mollicutes bacterium LVI A0039]|nr:ABC transporter permease subunit [Mollicutes bacterium LVI A0039]